MNSKKIISEFASDLINKDVLEDMSKIIDDARFAAIKSLENILIKRNWLIGKRIHEEELKETRKDNYGQEIIKQLSIALTAIYGKGFSKSNLYMYYRFYIFYPNLFNGETSNKKKLLTRSHYMLLVLINDKKARDRYEQEAINCAWPVRTLERNIHSHYYYRLIQIDENQNDCEIQGDKEKSLNKLVYFKNPYILEFLGLNQDENFLEIDLETAIISNLPSFLIELGKGFAFIGRQYHVQTKNRDYYVDLVFYNYHLKCFVIIDLKTEKITHNDVGQMDMYVRMFDKLVKSKDDNPTVGIILCADNDEDVVCYSVLNDSDNIFASKYKLYLPTDEELKAEINKQKELFYLCHKEKITKK